MRRIGIGVVNRRAEGAREGVDTVVAPGPAGCKSFPASEFACLKEKKKGERRREKKIK